MLRLKSVTLSPPLDQWALVKFSPGMDSPSEWACILISKGPRTHLMFDNLDQGPSIYPGF